MDLYPRPLRLAEDHWLSFPGGSSVRLGGSEYFLDVIHGFRFIERDSSPVAYSIATTRYSYTVLDRHHQELLAYHYHPSGVSCRTYPHLHISGAASPFPGKAHLTTGWVSLPAVIRMLIEDPASPVVSLRPDWPQVLDAASGPPTS